jgi:hypothetical protein
MLYNTVYQFRSRKLSRKALLHQILRHLSYFLASQFFKQTKFTGYILIIEIFVNVNGKSTGSV